VRQCGDLGNLELVEPIKMTESGMVALEQPRHEAGAGLLIAGLRVRYSNETIAGIPMQWLRFGPLIGTVTGRIGGVAYGVCCEFDEAGQFDYVTGVAVSSLSGLAPDLSGVRIPPQPYLVFRHPGHVSGIAATWHAIMGQWLPESGLHMANAPNFERYAENFDANTGLGGVEIWVPIEQ
jgi:AraC family transcriptional regulator